MEKRRKKKAANTCAVLQSRKKKKKTVCYIPRVISLPIASPGHVSHSCALHWAVETRQRERLANAVAMATVWRGHAAS